MSIEGAGECDKCGAGSDYCMLETPVGISIDCRQLELIDKRELDFYKNLAREISGLDDETLDHLGGFDTPKCGTPSCGAKESGEDYK